MDEYIKQLNEIYEECSEQNWGCYQEEPVQKETIDKVIRFLKLFKEEDLPFDTEAFSPEPDGSISVEWFNKINNQFSVSIDYYSDNRLAMAGIMDGSTFCGAIEYDEKSVPDIILTLIQQLKEKRYK